MALKLDVSKAYDMVEWIFVESILLDMGVPLKWRFDWDVSQRFLSLF